MRKTLLMIVPLLVGVLLFSTCEQPTEPDTTPPTVTITSPVGGSTVSVIVSITCMSSDNEGVDKVELWVNGVPIGLTDNTEPYSFEWNTITYDDGSYTIIVRSYDTSGNTTDSNPITLIVYKTVELWGEYYSIENTTDIELQQSGLTGSIPPEIGNLINLDELHLNINNLTGEIPPEIGNLTNLTELVLSSNNLTGEIPPEIGHLTNLTNLKLHGNQLTGEIPQKIGNLTNMEYLNLCCNQLSGEIPSEICNLTNIILNNWHLYQNQLCPPYPSCVEDYVGEQDTSNCP